MGSSLSSKRNIVDNVTNFVTGLKRKHSESEDDGANKVIEIALHTPKKRKLLCTAKYIYQALFLEGKNSDVTVYALGKEHHLHKVYLCQSPYFASMFGGSWLETTQKYIKINVVDPAITLESLHVVFGSLYNSDIALNPSEIVPILATAMMLQLEGLIEHCTEVMTETINSVTALEYFNAACQYGDLKLREACIRWFLVNLMLNYYGDPDMQLHTISIPLMRELVANPDLFTIQTEYSVYVMLKCWTYSVLHPNEGKPTTAVVNEYFNNRTGKTPFLYTSQGKDFTPVFLELKLQNLISHQLDIGLIMKDNIIPKYWLNPVILKQWKTVLQVNQNEEKGPINVSDEVFLRESIRCGRVVNSKDRHIWRWTGFHFGIDLLMITDENTLSIKRNHRSEFEQLLSFQTERHIIIRVTVVRLNEQKQITYMKQSDIKRVSLSKGEEVTLLAFDHDVEYPLIISANILYTTPEGGEDENSANCEGNSSSLNSTSN